MSSFEWIVIGLGLLLLFLLWYIHRNLNSLFVRTVNELGAIRAAIETTARSYLGLESVWEAQQRTTGQYGGSVVLTTAEDMPVLSGRRMGDVFAEMARELNHIRKIIEISGNSMSARQSG